MKKTNNFLALTAILLLSLAACSLPESTLHNAAPTEAGVNVVLVGDSTVATWGGDRPERGWGQMIPDYFNANARFANHAVSGRSAKTFISEGRWAKVLETLGPNDYVLIQFGHNDSHDSSSPEATDAFGNYQAYLKQYIADTRAKGATPILVTPMYRRSFDDEGKLLPYLIDDDGNHIYNLQPYAKAMRQVAKSTEVTLIDLFSMSGDLLRELGAEASATLFAPNDPAHWNHKGAICMASLVSRGISESDEALKRNLLPGVTRSKFSRGSTAKTADAPVVSEGAKSNRDFAVVKSATAATIVYSAKDAKVVEIAANLFAKDIERVSGVHPSVKTSISDVRGSLILIGTLGQSPEIDALAASGKIDVSAIEGGWEQYRIQVVEKPYPGVPQALVIAGSDRRGAAYGVFSLSEEMGVSPWYWWADSPTESMPEIRVSATPFTSKAPSVLYRGIFINDEDWGLQEWAEKNFESGPDEVKDMGPKTYAKIFELLLRLKANLVWPAMHPSTKAFNYYPENKQVADDYAIVMGSSHAEPMLRNNVDEWDEDKYGEWNPVENLQSISNYWEQRVRENSPYENIFTVGIRGIHDSGMTGGGSLEEKRERLEDIIALQRGLLEKHVDADPSRVPQLFCPYKEVLKLYQSGMELPNDITIAWPDDNHGYIRQLPNTAERMRAGGHGVYYHISYWGRPHDYLWLESTSPAHIWLEMTKAYDLGARHLWVLNIGDIKPLEAGMDLFLDLAWNVDAYGPDVQREFLHGFYEQQFGPKYADSIAALKDEYFRLSSIRRPEHMGFNRIYPNTPIQDSYWSHSPENDEAQQMLDRWIKLAEDTATFADQLSAEMRPAYFQLVEYPALAASAMVEKILWAEKARRTGSVEQARKAKAALQRIETLTEEYNSHNGGKWREMMDYSPRDLPVFGMPPTAQQADSEENARHQQRAREIEIDPTSFESSRGHKDAAWQVIDGLSPRGVAIAVLPHQDVPTLRTPEAVRERAPVTEYTIETEQSGEVEILVEALPTHPFTPEHEVLTAVSINDSDPVFVHFDRGGDGEYNEKWQANVLRHAMHGSVNLTVPEGSFTLKLWAADRALVVQKITLTFVP